MTLDPKIRDTIAQATSDLGQDPGLAYKLTAWLDALAVNESLADRDFIHRRLELPHDVTTTDIDDETTNGGQ